MKRFVFQFEHMQNLAKDQMWGEGEGWEWNMLWFQWKMENYSVSPDLGVLILVEEFSILPRHPEPHSALYGLIFYPYWDEDVVIELSSENSYLQDNCCYLDMIVVNKSRTLINQ